jgi:hypothetical protein
MSVAIQAADDVDAQVKKNSFDEEFSSHYTSYQQGEDDRRGTLYFSDLTITLGSKYCPLPW